MTLLVSQREISWLNALAEAKAEARVVTPARVPSGDIGVEGSAPLKDIAEVGDILRFPERHGWDELCGGINWTQASNGGFAQASSNMGRQVGVGDDRSGQGKRIGLGCPGVR